MHQQTEIHHRRCRRGDGQLQQPAGAGHIRPHLPIGIHQRILILQGVGRPGLRGEGQADCFGGSIEAGTEARPRVEEFGVAVVGDQSSHGLFRSGGTKVVTLVACAAAAPVDWAVQVIAKLLHGMGLGNCEYRIGN